MKLKMIVGITLFSLILAACTPGAASTPEKEPTQGEPGYPAPGNSDPEAGYPAPNDSTPEAGYPAPGVKDDLLNGTGWILASLNGQPALEKVNVTLSFEEGNLGGSDGCNSFGGSYAASGATLSVGKEIVSTMMACEEPIMEQASAFIAALTQTASFSMEGEQLTLADANGQTLATLTRQSRELSGTAWQVTGYNDGRQAVVSVLNGSELTLAFNADGTLNGSAGCNDYSSTYTVDGTTIQIAPPVATKMACSEPQGVMEQETQFLLALESAATFRMDGDLLELRTSDGSLAVTLTRAQE